MAFFRMTCLVRCWIAAALVWRCSGLSVRFLNKGPINVGLNNVLVLDAKFELRPGENIRLVTWDRKVDSTENRLVTNDEPTDKARISVENGRARLRLINFRDSDQGLYVITVTDGNGDQTSDSLFVRVVQKPPEAKLSLDCSMVVEGAQWDIPVFSWWVDGVQVDNQTANHSADGSKLHLSGSLANNYTCIITSSLGTTRVQHLRDPDPGQEPKTTPTPEISHDCTGLLWGLVVTSVILGCIVIWLAWKHRRKCWEWWKRTVPHSDNS